MSGVALHPVVVNTFAYQANDGTVTNGAAALVQTAASGFSSLSSTVSGHTTSINNNTNAISTLNTNYTNLTNNTLPLYETISDLTANYYTRTQIAALKSLRSHVRMIYATANVSLPSGTQKSIPGVTFSTSPSTYSFDNSNNLVFDSIGTYSIRGQVRVVTGGAVPTSSATIDLFAVDTTILYCQTSFNCTNLGNNVTFYIPFGFDIEVKNVASGLNLSVANNTSVTMSINMSGSITRLFSASSATA